MLVVRAAITNIEPWSYACLFVLYRGYNIGIRLIDEFLAKSGVGNCSDFKETAEVIAKIAFKMFLGVNAEVAHWNAENNACSLLIYENPLTGASLVTLNPSAGLYEQSLVTNNCCCFFVCRICGAATKRLRRALVLERTLRRAAWGARDGADARGGALREGRVAGRRGVGDSVRSVRMKWPLQVDCCDDCLTRVLVLLVVVQTGAQGDD